MTDENVSIPQINRQRLDGLEQSQNELWRQWNKHKDSWQDRVNEQVKESEQRAKEHADSGDRNVANAVLVRFVFIMVGLLTVHTVVNQMLA